MLERPPYSDCVPSSLISIASNITSSLIDLDSDADSLRRRDWEMLCTIEGNIDESRRHALSRLDKHIIIRYIRELTNLSSSPVGKILKECEVSFTTGGEDKIRKSLAEGYEVGLIVGICDPYAASDTVQQHMFHIAVDDEGKLINASDDPSPYSIEFPRIKYALEEGRIDSMIEAGREVAGGWNLLLVKPL